MKLGLRIRCLDRLKNTIGVRYKVPQIMQSSSRDSGKQSVRFFKQVLSENQQWGHGGIVNPFYVNGVMLFRGCVKLSVRIRCWERLKNLTGVQYTVPQIMQSLSHDSGRPSVRFFQPVLSENRYWRHGSIINHFYVH